MERHLSSAECMLVRETMVRQEKVYREQVQALHYLYQVQKTLMDEHVAKSCWNSSSKPVMEQAGFQFFPARDEAPAEPPKRKFLFDLEKLPDECLEPEPEPEPEPSSFVSRNGDAGVDLVLHSPLMDSNPGSRTPASKPTSEFHIYQPQWLPENSWKPTTSYSQLGNSWLQLASQGSTPQEQAVPWYAQRSAVPAHPWQAPGAPFYSQEPCSSSGLQGTYFPNGSLGNLLSNGFSGDFMGSFGKPGMKAPGFYHQQEEDRFQRNGQVHGYGNVLLDYLVARETPHQGAPWKSNSCVFGDRNFFRESVNTATIQRTCGPARDLGFEVQNSLFGDQRARCRGEKLPSFGAGDPFVLKETGIEVAASVLVSLGSDASYCPKVSSPGSLKKSVEWFADAIPSEVSEEKQPEQPEQKPEPEDGSSEIDQFEAEMLLLKESCFEDHAPLVVEVEQTVAGPPRSNKGRPSRVCKRKRDFRSDTLPSITSLSRQEINEDIQMMSGLLRSSRELKSDRRGSSSKVCRMKNSTSPVSTLDMNKVPWLVSWGVASRRKRKKRQRVNSLNSQKAAKGPASGGLSVFSSVINIKMQ